MYPVRSRVPPAPVPVLAVASLLIASAPWRAASADTFNVTTTADAPAANPSVSANTAGGQVSLRSAIQRANALAASGSHVINLTAGATYRLTIALPASPTTADLTDAALGDLDIRCSLTINGDPTSTGVKATVSAGNDVAGGNNDRVFKIRPHATSGSAYTVVLNDLVIRDGKTTGTLTDYSGGGVLVPSGSSTTLFASPLLGNVDVAFNRCTITANSTEGQNGGGLSFFLNANSATLGIRNNVIDFADCTVSGNSARGGGGMQLSSTTANLVRCTISGNTVTFANGGGFNVNGISSVVTLTNCTISGNSAVGNGGGYNNIASGTDTFNHCTIVNNVADSDNANGGTGGGIYKNSGTANLKNSIVSGNTAGTGASTVTSDTAVGGGTINNQGGNVIGGVTGLGTLANNGGLTQTHALSVGSNASGA